MKWLINLKISKKLIISFILIALISGIMGAYGIYSLKVANTLDIELYKDMTVPISEMGKLSTEFHELRVDIRDLISLQSPEDIAAKVKEIEEIRSNMDKLADSFSKTNISSDIRKQYDTFVEARNAYKPGLDKVIELAKANKDDEATAMNAQNAKLGQNQRDALEKLISMEIDEAEDKSNLNTRNVNATITVMFVIIIFVMIIAILIGVYISGLITKPLEKILNTIKEHEKGHLSERTNINSNDEIGEVAKTMDKFASDLDVYLIGAMDRIGKGDLNMDIPIKDEKDRVGPALIKMMETIRGIDNEIAKLVKAAIEGKLDVRGSEDLYSGAWKEIIAEINRLIDAFIAPINVTAEYVDRISKGDIPEKITEIYYGDFNKIKNNLNNCIDNVRALVIDANMLSKAAAEGKLDVRADETKHSGDFKKIVEGVNELIEAMVKPIQEVTSVMGQMNEGILGIPVKGDYKGEFGVLAKSINDFREHLKNFVQEVSEIMGEISEGNLAIETIKPFRGDFKMMSVSLNTIIDSLNSVIQEINTASEQVYIGAGQVSDSSQILSQGATQQASAVEELNASISDIALQTKENANNANEAKALAFKVKENAESGNKHMSEMLNSMSAINESSANISKIIKVIDEIAFQTNILALNAAVEAARAGQHGKGFAVVAEEVRNLAARSANAAKETTDLIEGSIKKAETGTEIANNTAKALYEIVDGVSKAAVLVAEIAASSQEQASGIAQINVGIEQVSQVVQTNSATAEESAAASEELSSQAELLKDRVSNFKLKNGNQNMNSSLNNIIKNKKNKQPYNTENNMTFKEVSATVKKSKIALNDEEFGKY